MNERVTRSELEESLRAALDAPAPRPEFAHELGSRLVQRAETLRPRRAARLRPAWAVVLGILIVLAAALLIAGPQRVAAAVQRLFGYLPGVGIVDRNAPLRVLAAPVTMTRDGVTLSVTQAVLSGDKTVVTYTLTGVPWSAYSHVESIPGCAGMASLRLPAGSVLDLTGGGGSATAYSLTYPPIPPDVTSATFLLPCIGDTLPGLAPENWELPLAFVPAPANLALLPVIDVVPTPTAAAASVAPAAANPLSVTRVIDAGDTYILLGELNDRLAADTSLPAGSTWSQTDAYRISDANGQEVYYSFPGDPSLTSPVTQPGSESWAVQFSKRLAFPLTISLSGQFIEPADPPVEATFPFDAGPNPRPGQTWTLNRNFTLDGHRVTLDSIEVDGRGGYTFSFESDGSVAGLGLEIVDYPSQGGGGGGGPAGGPWSVGLSYAVLPTGSLTIRLSNLTLVGPSKTWSLSWSPEAAPSASDSLYGLSLSVDRAIELPDGFYLIGHTAWTDARISSAAPSGWAFKAYDSSAQEIPLEPGDASAAGLSLEPGQWIYHLYGKAFYGPLTLRLDRMDVQFAAPLTFSLGDLRSFGFTGADDQLGLAWKTGLIPLDFPGLQAEAYRAEYVRQGDLTGFAIGIQADPALLALPLAVTSPVQGGSGAGGGGSSRDAQTGILESYVLSDGQFTFPLQLAAGSATVSGSWAATWMPPDSSAPSAAPVPAACLTLDDWKRALQSAPALPAGLGGKLAVYGRVLDDGRSPSPSNYGAFVMNLDGSGRKVLGTGITPSLSPDGRLAVYQSDDGLHEVNLTAGTDRLVPGSTPDDNTPRWSPNATQIAFVRAGEAAVYLVNADGSGLRRLVQGRELEQTVGWSPDASRVYYITVSSADRLLRSVSVADGSVTDVLDLGADASYPALSTDGQWLAYLDKVVGRMTDGIYISRLDGSQRRLAAQLDYWMVADPLWSPDGRWLALGVVDTDQYVQTSAPALLNLQSCQVYPLAGIEGELDGWVP